MAPAKKSGGNKKKALPANPLAGVGAAAKSQDKSKKSPLFEKRSRNYRLGGDIQPKRDLTRFVKWPKYIRLQRQKRIMLQRLKVPPSIAQFSHTLEKDQAVQLLRLLKKLKPETRAEKKERLSKMAEAQKAGKDVESKAPTVLKFGLNHVTQLVEDKKAKLVIIAHDVDPIETILWLPALCRKKDIPYCIIKSKSRLGQLVGKKTATCLAVTNVAAADSKELSQITEIARASFNDNVSARRTWGGGVPGVKSRHIQEKRQALLEIEAAKKAGLQL